MNLAGLITLVILGITPWELANGPDVNDRPSPQENETVRVSIDKDGKTDAFPRYFNQLEVRKIEFDFEDTPNARRRFSVIWNGGSKGPDGFTILVDGIATGSSQRVNTERYPYTWYRSEFFFRMGSEKRHQIQIIPLKGLESALEFSAFQLSEADAPQYLAPCYESLQSLKDYQQKLGKRGALVVTPHIRIFAPADLEKDARELAKDLERAHTSLRALFSLDPIFKTTIEHFPKGHPRGWGGISGVGTIGYPIESLLRYKQMKTRDVRGIAGYTEEMTHGFKEYYRCRGTSEALGVAVQEDLIRKLVNRRTADGYWKSRHLQWQETYDAFIGAGKKNPDLKRFPENIFLTRLLNQFFRQLRNEYGEDLWPDFFKMIRQMDYPFHRAKEGERLGVYADVFSALFGRDIRQDFHEFGIDVK